LVLKTRIKHKWSCQSLSWGLWMVCENRGKWRWRWSKGEMELELKLGATVEWFHLLAINEIALMQFRCTKINNNWRWLMAKVTVAVKASCLWRLQHAGNL